MPTTLKYYYGSFYLNAAAAPPSVRSGSALRMKQSLPVPPLISWPDSGSNFGEQEEDYESNSFPDSSSSSTTPSSNLHSLVVKEGVPLRPKEKRFIDPNYNPSTTITTEHILRASMAVSIIVGIKIANDNFRGNNAGEFMSKLGFLSDDQLNDMNDITKITFRHGAEAVSCGAMGELNITLVADTTQEYEGWGKEHKTYIPYMRCIPQADVVAALFANVFVAPNYTSTYVVKHGSITQRHTRRMTGRIG